MEKLDWIWVLRFIFISLLQGKAPDIMSDSYMSSDIALKVSKSKDVQCSALGVATSDRLQTQLSFVVTGMRAVVADLILQFVRGYISELDASLLKWSMDQNYKLDPRIFSSSVEGLEY